MRLRVWQIASGSHGRDYSRLLRDHDFACLGPGDPGEYDPATYDPLIEQGRLSGQKAGAIRHFKESVRPGDHVLLRLGHRVVAIGVFAEEDYSWDPGLDDVRGWDLQHSRRVIWQDELSGDLDRVQRHAPLFGDRKQIPMFTRVHHESILEPIRKLLRRAETRDLRPLPEPHSEILDDEALAAVLFARGLSNRATEDVVRVLDRQRRLINWYREHGRAVGRPTEHEVVAHIILPLLLALGWSEQLLAVEWNRIDLAGFSSAPTTAASCSLVCEAKGLGHGLAGVLGQATGYVDQQALDNCRRILLTDGARFYVYAKRDDEWGLDPASYLNIHKPRLRNADGTDAVELIMTLRQQ